MANVSYFPPSSLEGSIVENFFYEQLNEWNLAKQNYDALKKVKTKEFDFGDFAVRVQFNPARIQSSAAKVDSQSLHERQCFLCQHNLPPTQRGLFFGEEYQILVNPYPVFPMHLTVPAPHHTEQLIDGRYGDMLNLAKSLDNFVVFYNGPRCGASAPDHLHFQAGNKGFLPLEKDVKNVSRKTIVRNSEIYIYTLNNYLRNVLVIESASSSKMEHHFVEICSSFNINDSDSEKEPMLNIITWFEAGKWTSAIFPRAVHRPKCFYADGSDNLLISPASVDMGGVLITPRENDFDRINAENVRQILKEVCFGNE
ncbi:MAG: DUF4922 domain-containing protein [Cytophagaceae bacterium]|jgi:ATP adenylyltransferase/5',5'''-P-1,P-4-tetraphosphate phosphorylase II|nr:DUF4922 domain-containing protein [Cytophagaceae bacterium]